MQREMITRTIDLYRGLNDLPLIEVIDRLAEAMKLVPEESRKSARFEPVITDEYGDEYIDISITYQSLETDEELRARLYRERLAEEKERALYEKLKKKFEEK